MEGATCHDHEIPDNPVNDWLVETQMARFGILPDVFTAGGMAAGLAVAEAVERAGSNDTEALIATMGGMDREAPKGTMRFRAEDHQALQSMYHLRIRVEDDVDRAIPERVRELTIEDLPIPVRNR